MIGTFLYLTLCSLRNRTRVRVRRLREPRYLAGFLAGAAYLYFVVFSRGYRSSRSAARIGTGAAASPIAALAQLGAPLHFVGSLFMLLFAVLAWLWPASRRPIDFTRSEVQFLFTAPLTRRQLIHYKVLRSQVALLFGSIVATVFLRPSTFVTGWTLTVGMWIVLITIRLHSMGVSLSRMSLAERGAGDLVRRWLPVGVVVGAVVTLAATAAGDWATLSSLSDPVATLKELQRIWTSGACGWILWPFLAMVRLPLSGSAGEFLRALPAALAIVALNYVWVLQADASFEEAAADRAEKIASLKTAPRRAVVRAMPTPFALAPQGRPELAIMWKNLILIGRFASLKVLLRLLPMVVVFGIALSSGLRNGGLVALLAMVCAMSIFMVVMVGAQMARNDLRQDLGRLAVLKAWPLRGATLLRGEVAAPAAMLTGIVWLLIAALATLVPHVQDVHGRLADAVLGRLSYATAGLLLAPAIILTQLVVVNGIAVIFPAWIAVGSSRARGIDAMGQRMLMMFGIWLTLIVALIPAALIAGIAGFAIYWTTHVVPVIVPAALAAVVVVAECWVAVELLGNVLDRTDIGAVEAAE